MKRRGPRTKWQRIIRETIFEVLIGAAIGLAFDMFEIRMYMSRSMRNIYRMIRTSSLSGSQKQLLIRVVKIWRM